MTMWLSSLGQDIKSFEYAKHYQKHKVQSKKCVEIRFLGNVPIDTLVVSLEEFDRIGRISRYIEYDRRSMPEAEYHFDYDASGNVRITVAHKYSDWEEIALIPEYDAKNRLVARTPSVKPNGFWDKETFNYDVNGNVTSRDRWYNVDGESKPVINRSFPETVEKDESSLSYIFDEHDLLIIEQLYRGGVSDKSRNYVYTFY